MRITAKDTALTKRANREHLRAQVVEMIARGGSVPVIAEAFQIPVSKVYRIIQAVNQANARSVKTSDPLKVVGEAVAGYLQIAREAYQNYAQAQNANVKAMWLRLALNARDSLNDLRSRVGLIPTVTQQINLTAQLEVEWYGDKDVSAAELMSELRGVGNLTN